MPSDRTRPRHDGVSPEPSPFPPGPSPDHPTIPIGRRWWVAGSVVGAVVIVLVAAVLGDRGDTGPDYEEVTPTAVRIDDGSSATLSVQIDPAAPEEGRVKVTGSDLVRVDVAGAALCAPVSGAADAWIGIVLCGRLDTLAVTAYDIDDSATTVIAEF